MIVLDASVLIAHLAGNDHSMAALDILDTEEDLVVHPLTLAEILVGPAKIGREDEVVGHLERIGIATTTPSSDEPVRLARARAETGLKLPDCCVVVTAQREQATLATFDDRLMRTARTLGLDVAGPTD